MKAHRSQTASRGLRRCAVLIIRDGSLPNASPGLRREGRAPAACPNALEEREESPRQERRLGLSKGLSAKSLQGRKRWAGANCNTLDSRRMRRCARSANKAPPESRRPYREGRQSWDAGNARARRRRKRPPLAAMSPVRERSERAWMPPTTAYGAWIIGVKRAADNTKILYGPRTYALVASQLLSTIKLSALLS